MTHIFLKCDILHNLKYIKCFYFYSNFECVTSTCKRVFVHCGTAIFTEVKDQMGAHSDTFKCLLLFLYGINKVLFLTPQQN